MHRIALLFILVLGAGCISRAPTTMDFCTTHTCITKIISGNSMAPSIKDGDSVRVGIDYYHFNPVARGDVVLIDFNFDNNLRMKRVVGLQGDKIELLEGDLAINGKKVLIHPAGKPFTLDSFTLFKIYAPATSLIVPRSRVMVLSDAGGAGFDSLDYGFVDPVLFVGKVIEIIPQSSVDANDSH